MRVFATIAASLLLIGGVFAALGTGWAARRMRRFEKSGRRAARESKLVGQGRRVPLIATGPKGGCGGPSCAVS